MATDVLASGASRTGCRSSAAAATTFLAASVRSSAVMMSTSLSARILRPFFDFGPFQAHDQRHVEADRLVGFEQARWRSSCSCMMPPKMLTSTALTFLSASRMRNASVTCSTFGAAAHVQEVGRLAAVQLDEVHRAHRQPGAVDQAADIAVQLDVAQSRLAGSDFGRLLFAQVAQLGDVRVPEQGVVVEGHLGVQGHQFAVAGDHQRIDFGQAAIELRRTPGTAPA